MYIYIYYSNYVYAIISIYTNLPCIYIYIYINIFIHLIDIIYISYPHRYIHHINHFHRWINQILSMNSNRLPRNSQRWHRRSSLPVEPVKRYAPVLIQVQPVGISTPCFIWSINPLIVITKNWLYIDDTPCTL